MNFVEKLNSDKLFKIQKKINLVLLVAIVVTLPHTVLFNSYLIALFGANWLFDKEILKKIGWTLSNKWFWLFSSLYFVQILGLFYSEDISATLKILETKASLIVFPLIFFGSYKLSKKELYIVLLSFCFSILLSAVFYFFQTIYKVQSPDTPFIYPNINDFLSSLFLIGHVYYGLYLAFSIIVISYLIYKGRENINFYQKLLGVVSSLFMIFMIFMIGARNSAYSLILLGIVSWLYLALSKKRYKQILLVFSVLSLFVVGLFSIENEFQKRFLSVFNSSLSHNSLYLRTIKWNCGFNIWTKNLGNFFFGVGTGDVQEFLQICYQKARYWGHQYRLNVHNEFIAETLRHGLLGLAIFVISLVLPFALSFKKKFYLYAFFIYLFSMASLTENTLGRQKGVVWFSLFNSILFTSMIPLNNKEKQIDFIAK